MSHQQTPPAGWYPDPEHPGQRRYWDGGAWAAAGTAPVHLIVEAPRRRFRVVGAVLLIAAGVAVFLVCSQIQASAGTSMFEIGYDQPDGAVDDWLINVTFYPGWTITVLLIVMGIARLFD